MNYDCSSPETMLATPTYLRESMLLCQRKMKSHSQPVQYQRPFLRSQMTPKNASPPPKGAECASGYASPLTRPRVQTLAALLAACLAFPMVYDESLESDQARLQGKIRRGYRTGKGWLRKYTGRGVTQHESEKSEPKRFIPSGISVSPSGTILMMK